MDDGLPMFLGQGPLRSRRPVTCNRDDGGEHRCVLVSQREKTITAVVASSTVGGVKVLIHKLRPLKDQSMALDTRFFGQLTRRHFGRRWPRRASRWNRIGRRAPQRSETSLSTPRLKNESAQPETGIVLQLLDGGPRASTHSRSMALGRRGPAT